MTILDNSTEVRKGEELDSASLLNYLNQVFRRQEGEVDIRQFPAGFSNLTYQVRFSGEDLVLRRPPHGAKIKSGHDMSREFKVLSGLKSIYDKVPEAIAYCEDESVIGAPFYLMKRVSGVILRPKIKPAQWPEKSVMNGISVSLIETLAGLHKLDYKAAGLAELGRPEGYVNRQVEGWIKRYAKSKTDDLKEVDEVAKWLSENQIKHDQVSLIHNDFKYDNVVLDSTEMTRIIAILDWEMCTLGDPLMDLGTTLGYWVNDDDPDWLKKLALSPTLIPGNLSRTEVVNVYFAMNDLQANDLVFYYVFGLFKIGVIVQQIYYRYQVGLTSDERFAQLIHAVRGLAIHANQAIARNRLDQLYA